MYFDRFDVCEAYYLAFSHCHSGQFSKEYRRLCKMQHYFNPRTNLSVDSLSENAKTIYDNLCEKLLVLT